MKYIIITVVAVLSALGMYFGSDIVSMFDTETVSTRATSTPILERITQETDDTDEARKAIEEATKKLNAKEEKILAEKEAASSTINAKIAELEAELEMKNAGFDAEIDRINEVRASF